MLTRRLNVLILVAGLTLPAMAQCVDPNAPASGFPLVQTSNLPLVWSDGYQTLADIRYPIVPPGPCGWPVIILVHGSGGDRNAVQNEATDLASRGYFTLAYDVRGQGVGPAVNPPALGHDITGLRELIDLFEAMEAAETLYPALVDFDRIGVTGYSQGGGHSWWAAQYSGQNPPTNPWRTAVFPTVGAVVVRDAGDRIDANPITFRHRSIERMFSNAGVQYRPAARAVAQAAVLLEDFAGFAAVTQDPGMDPTVYLPQVTVPVYAHASYDDKRINPSGIYRTWDLVPSTTPKKLQLGTGGHDSPDNLYDRSLFIQNRRAWFDRFLKNDLNGIDTGPAIIAGVTPENVGPYQNANTLWDFRRQDAIPTTTTNVQRLFLGPNTLSNTAPAAAGTLPVNHAVPGALDIAAYTTLLPTAGQLMGMIPLSNQEYTSGPLTQDRMVQGEIEIGLGVNASAPNFQLQASIHDLDPAGNLRWVAAGHVAVRGNAGPQVVTCRTYLQSYVFRQGHSIVLRVQNLAIHNPPTGSAPEIKIVPYFDSSVVNVRHGGAMPSYIDIPFLPYENPTLVAYPLQQSASGLANQRMEVHTHNGAAGNAYFILPSFAGTSPGTLVGATLIPLNFDFLTGAVVANPFMAPFVNIYGALDPEGHTLAGINLAGLTLPGSFVGLDFSMVAAVATPTGIRVSEPVSIPIVP